MRDCQRVWLLCASYWCLQHNKKNPSILRLHARRNNCIEVILCVQRKTKKYFCIHREPYTARIKISIRKKGRRRRRGKGKTESSTICHWIFPFIVHASVPKKFFFSWAQNFFFCSGSEVFAIDFSTASIFLQH